MQDSVVKLFSAANRMLYKASRGRMGNSFAGAPVLLLTVVGRKSGVERTVPLVYLKDDDRYVVVASKGGDVKDPVWWLNLKANPEAVVQVGPHVLPVVAEAAGPAERARLWPKLVKMQPLYESYRKKTDREFPIVILHPLVLPEELPSGGNERLLTALGLAAGATLAGYLVWRAVHRTEE